MANEAVIIELLGNRGDVVRYTCADGNGIEKGTLLWMTDPRTISGASAVQKPFAGIAAEEKVANDGQTSIGVFTNGIFDIYADAAIAAGTFVTISGQNKVKTATTADILSGCAIGRALETASAAETIAVKIGGIL